MRTQKNSYDNDFYGWILSQANLLKHEEYKKVDWHNVIEEIEALGRSEKRTLKSYLRVLLMHMLKWEYQPEKRTTSWSISIKNSRDDAKETLQENPSLKSKVDELLESAYKSARRDAAIETDLPEKTFPKKCPWTLKEILK
jgi:hypothetical protein